MDRAEFPPLADRAEPRPTTWAPTVVPGAAVHLPTGRTVRHLWPGVFPAPAPEHACRHVAERLTAAVMTPGATVLPGNCVGYTVLER
jgi:hypothetical protein